MIFYFILAAITLWIYLTFIRQARTKVPPGMKVIPSEKGLPIVGILHGIKGPLCDTLTKLSKKHGPIYFIKFGMRDILVLNNYEYMKAALIDNGEAFSGRWQLKLHTNESGGHGILNTDGRLWTEQRPYLLRTLKDFGIGRSKSVEIVQDECISLLKSLEELNLKAIEFTDFISLHTVNIISKFIMDKRFTHEDLELKIIEKTVKIVGDTKDRFSNFCLMVPFLDGNLWLVKLLTWIFSRGSVYRDSHRIFAKEIKEHLETLDFNSSGEDLIERFLIKQHQMKEKEGNVGSFTNRQLITSAFELFIAGYDTTSSTLTWSFMFMSMYKEVQEKVHEEICDKIGSERLPTMSDKPSLAYTQAVMDEIMRLGAVVPLSLMHRTLKNTCVNEYFIPKNTLVMPNIFACHTDPTIWEKPLEFYPGHFLSTDEEGNCKYRPREELIPFSMGKRQCLGESLARTEYFIFFTGIMQRFQVRLADGEAGKKNLLQPPYSDGVIRKTYLKKFVFKKRN